MVSALLLGLFLAAIGAVPVVLIAMSLRVIKAGQLGLVFLFGIYVQTLLPGLNRVNPFASVQRIVVGSGPN